MMSKFRRSKIYPLPLLASWADPRGGSGRQLASMSRRWSSSSSAAPPAARFAPKFPVGVRGTEDEDEKINTSARKINADVPTFFQAGQIWSEGQVKKIARLSFA